MTHELEQKARGLLGKKVRVTLIEKGPVVVHGLLLGFGSEGEFEILEADGQMHYCWPMLDIEEVTNSE